MVKAGLGARGLTRAATVGATVVTAFGVGEIEEIRPDGVRVVELQVQQKQQSSHSMTPWARRDSSADWFDLFGLGYCPCKREKCVACSGYQREWQDMEGEDEPAAVTKAAAWLNDWFDPGEFGLQTVAAAVAKADRAPVTPAAPRLPPPRSHLPPPRIPPLTVPTPKTVRVSSAPIPSSQPTAQLSQRPVNEETWTEMRIQDCCDRTRGELDKDRVSILDGMTVADALERKLPFDGGDGEVTLTMLLTPALLAADVRSGLYRLVGNQPTTQQP
jgi:hypothetical protein